MLSTSTKVLNFYKNNFEAFQNLVLQEYQWKLINSKVIMPTLIIFQSFDNPTSTRLWSHTLPLYLQFYYLLCHFINLKFPPPLGSWVMHYHCIYSFTIFFVVLLTLNSHLHPAHESYITTVVTYFILYVFILIWHTTLISPHLLECNTKFCLNFSLEKYELYTKILRW